MINFNKHRRIKLQTKVCGFIFEYNDKEVNCQNL